MIQRVSQRDQSLLVVNVVFNNNFFGAVPVAITFLEVLFSLVIERKVIIRILLESSCICFKPIFLLHGSAFTIIQRGVEWPGRRLDALTIAQALRCIFGHSYSTESAFE